MDKDYELIKPLFGHTRSVVSIVTVPNRVITGSADGSFRVWAQESWDCTHNVIAHRTAITYIMDVSVTAVAGSDSQPRWNTCLAGTWLSRLFVQ
jgi:WD40 repeat protein